MVLGISVLLLGVLLSGIFQYNMLGSMRNIGRGLSNGFPFAIQQLAREYDVFSIHLDYMQLALERQHADGDGTNMPSPLLQAATYNARLALDIMIARVRTLNEGAFPGFEQESSEKIRVLLRQVTALVEDMDRAFDQPVLTMPRDGSFAAIGSELYRTIGRLRIYLDRERRRNDEEAQENFNRMTALIIEIGLVAVLPSLVMIILLARQNQRLKEKKEQLQRMQQELESSLSRTTAILDSRNSLLANVSHEMRTPLNAIMGFSEIISRQFFGVIGNERYIAYARDIHDSSRSLLELVDDLLLLRSIEAGSHVVEMTDVRVAAIVERVHKSVAGLAAARSITLDVAQSEALSVQADERALRQILTNLVENAVKYSFEGGTVTLAVRREGKKVRFVILDEGPGIAADQIPGLFQPFQRGDNPMVRQAKGAGLGLAIVKALISAMGSSVHLAALEPRGLRVYFDLPEARRDYERGRAAGVAEASPA